MSIKKISLEDGKNEITEQEIKEYEDQDMIDSNNHASDPDVDGLRLWLSSMDINRSKEADNKEKLITSRRSYVEMYHKVMKKLTKGTRFDPNRNKRSALVYEDLDQDMHGSSNDEEENKYLNIYLI